RRADQGRRRGREVRDSRLRAGRGGERRRLPGGLERSAGNPGARRSHSRHARRAAARRASNQRRRRRGGNAAGGAPRRSRVRRVWEIRELSTICILGLEIAFFTWYLWPDTGRSHPFLNAANGMLILKYSSIYGIASIGAAIVIISGGIDLAPGALIALSGVVASCLFVEDHWSLGASTALGLSTAVACGVLSAILICIVRLPPFIATLGVMGIARGAAFIITEGRYFDVSGALPAGWRLLGVPLDWTSSLVMVALA